MEMAYSLPAAGANGSPTFNVTFERMFALIIGIDEYKDSPKVQNLSAAVNDAKAVNGFLTSKLGVSSDRIVNLYGQQATRKAIITAMQNLAANKKIDAQDPILIYYAGHGGEANPVPGWPTSTENGKIQMLIPYDFAFEGSKDFQGQGILDIEISRILVDIMESKSNNITVIFDCCHSGSGTRGLKTRSVMLGPEYSVPQKLFAALFSHPTGSLHSHVLLAACKQDELAAEGQDSGHFTKALLDLLGKENINKLTYTDVITRLHIPSPSQHPQCEGVHQNRILFTTEPGSPQPRSYSIKPVDKRPNEYVLDAGQAYGIENGAKFAIYRDQRLASGVVGYVVAHDAGPFTTRCSVDGDPFELPQHPYAVQTLRVQEHYLRLLVHPNDPSYGKLTELIQNKSTDVSMGTIRIMNVDSEEVDLALATLGDCLQFEIKNKICRQYGLTHMPFRVKLDREDLFCQILHGAADFYWRFHHSNKKDFTMAVDVECYKLISTHDHDHDHETLKPSEDQNLNKEGTIFIDTEDQPYGYKIINKSQYHLYAGLFYFDFSDLSIVQYYSPPAAPDQKVAISLPAKGSLTIGYGDGGWEARTYYLREGQGVDVGFLKLYVSTKYVDYSSMVQKSPFNSQGNRGDMPWRRGKIDSWGTLTIPIIQKLASP